MPYEVLQIYRRSDPSFCQGLFYDVSVGKMVESTGLYGESRTQWLNIDEDLGVVSPTNVVVDYDKK